MREPTHWPIGNSHGRQPKPAENQDRIQDQVDDRAAGLNIHVPNRVSRGLHHALAGKLETNAERKDHDNMQISRAVLNHGLIFAVQFHKGPGKQQPRHSKQQSKR